MDLTRIRFSVALVLALALMLPALAVAAAPNTTITGGPSGTVYTRTAKFSFTSSQSGSTFQCKLDAGAWAACTSPKTYTSLAFKAHTFFVRAKNSTGEVDTTPATRTWTVKPAVTVTVACTTNPEKTVVKNNSPSALTVKTVGSIDDPRDNEPFTVNRSLAGGATITFQSGSAATSNVLTRQHIYDNDAGTAEGARVATSVGTWVDRCG